MFTSKAKLKAAFDEGRKSYIESFEKLHKKLADKQAELERTFTMESITSFPVNVWDDYDEDANEGTYAYVEMREVPNKVCCDLLIYILEFAKSNPEIAQTGAKFNLKFYDSATMFPALVGRDRDELVLHQRWEIRITGANYETLEFIVDKLKSIPKYQGKQIDIYSES